MIFATGFEFDWTITLGNLLTTASFLLLAILAWRDLTWRVKNLETWRGENLKLWDRHLVDADARDQLIRNSEKMLARLETLVETLVEHEKAQKRREQRT